MYFPAMNGNAMYPQRYICICSNASALKAMSTHMSPVPLGYYRINRKESNSDRCRSPEVFYLTSINRINRDYHNHEYQNLYTRAMLKLICNIIVELLTKIQIPSLCRSSILLRLVLCIINYGIANNVKLNIHL